MTAHVVNKSVFIGDVEIGVAKHAFDAHFNAKVINDANGDPQKVEWWDPRLAEVLRELGP